MSSLVRYSLITKKLPREFLLLQGGGCIYKKCVYCDYYHDVSANPFEINKPIIDKISGATGVLDVINSGSCFELDDKTIDLIRAKAVEKGIHTIWFETHYLYKSKLNEFRAKFPGIQLEFRTGVETFNPKVRNFLKKGIAAQVSAEDIAKDFAGVCLLIGFEGQSRDDIINDISLARKLFERTVVNVFIENSTPLKQDRELVAWFKSEVYPKIKDDPAIEILLDNTDFGVG